MDQTHLMIYLVFAGCCMFLFLSMSKRLKEVKIQQAKIQEEFEQNKVKYQSLTSEVFDTLSPTELTHAVLYNILALEDSRYDGEEIDDTPIYDKLTDAQKKVYTIYQVERATQGKNASIHTFFIEEEYKPYVENVSDVYRTLKCYELADLLDGAKQLARIIELDLDEDVTGDYETYNFSDFTNQIVSITKSSNLIELTGNFIKENKEQFIIKEEN